MLAALLLLLSLLILALFSLPDRNIHVVVCDVGQGDAILVTYGTIQMLVDGGPDKRVLDCLGRHMPFWDRRVEVLVNTHPQLDHFGGFIDVLKRYRVDILARPEVDGQGAEWGKFMGEIREMGVTEKKIATGDTIRYSNLHFNILNPQVGYVGTDLNEYSVVGNLSFGSFDVLLTGDIIPPVIDGIGGIRPVEVLKVPHHGSKNGLTKTFLEKSSPKLAVVSVGKKNSYGHPHKELLEMLRVMGEIRGMMVMRTDLDGEIEMVSDGKSWWVKRGKSGLLGK